MGFSWEQSLEDAVSDAGVEWGPDRKDIGDSPKTVSPNKIRFQRNPYVVNIQKLILSYGYPIDEKHNKKPDGMFGPITHGSLLLLLKNEKFQKEHPEVFAQLKEVVSNDFKENKHNIKQIGEKVNEGRERTIKPSPKPVPEVKETFSIYMTRNGKENVLFPYATALISPEYLEATVGIDLLPQPKDKIKVLVEFVDSVINTGKLKNGKRVAEVFPNSITLLTGLRQKLIAKYKDMERRGIGKSMPLMEWVRSRFIGLLNKIPVERYPEIVHHIYSLNPSMISSNRMDAIIKDFSRLKTYSASIHKKLSDMYEESNPRDYKRITYR